MSSNRAIFYVSKNNVGLFYRYLPIAYLCLRGSLKIQPESGTKRASGGQKMDQGVLDTSAASLWSRDLCVCINKLFLSSNCKQVGVD